MLVESVIWQRIQEKTRLLELHELRMFSGALPRRLNGLIRIGTAGYRLDTSQDDMFCRSYEAVTFPKPRAERLGW